MTNITATIPETGTWTLDPAHTIVGFRVRHLMAAKVRGSFKSFEGTIEIGDTPTDSTIEVTMEAASIDTGATDRDAHLRSPDFLDADRHPHLRFRSTGVREVGERRYAIDGELEIRGITNPVTLDVTYLGLTTDPWGNDKALFTAETTIDRERWGLTWNQPLEAGGWLVGKQIEIELEVQAARA